MRVFELYGIIDRPSDHIYVRTIPMYGCMEICPHYIPFSYQVRLACHRKTCALDASPLKNYTLTSDPSGDHPGTEIFRLLNCLGYPPDQSSILQELVGL